MTLRMTPEQIEEANLAAQWRRLVLYAGPEVEWAAADHHAAIFRALQIDPRDPVSLYATLMCRLMRIDGKPVIVVAYPCPRTFVETETFEESFPWMVIKDLIIWDPTSNQARPFETFNPGLKGAFPEGDVGKVYGDPKAWLQDWARSRAQWLIHRNAIAAQQWTKPPEEPDHCPGVLMLGDPDKIHWPAFEMPRNIEVIGAPAAQINKAIMRSAQLPRVRQTHRAAA